MYSKFTKSTYAQSTIEVKTAVLVYAVKIPLFFRVIVEVDCPKVKIARG